METSGEALPSSLSANERDEALRNLRLIRRCLDGGVPLTRVAAEAGVSRWTLRRWIQRYRAEGLAGLCRRRRQDAGRRRLPEDLRHLSEGLALQRPEPRISWVCRQAQSVARDRGWPIPSYARVYKIVRGLDPGLLTYAHEGSKAYREAFDLIYRRESSSQNEVWLADHSVLNVATVDKFRRVSRPWLTVIVDDHSRSVPGYLLGFEAPSSLRTALALRQAIWRKEDVRWRVCGIPDRFYTDHGSDFTSRHMERVAADLRMELVFSTPGMPRGRGRIERFFQTVDQLSSSSLSGYWPAGAPEPANPLSLQELDARFREWLLADYHTSPNSETDEAPNARWETNGFLPQLPESQEHLDLLLPTVSKARKVHPDGIHFLGLRYTDPVLADYVGEDVVVRYDPRDLGAIWVFHGGRRLCPAVCPEIAACAVTYQDIRKAREARRSEVKAVMHSRKAVVERLLDVHHAERRHLPEQSAPPSPAPTGARLRRYENE